MRIEGGQNRLTAKEYLSQIEDLTECINQDLRRRHDELSMLKGIDYSADKVQSSPSGDGLCDQVCNLIELDQKIEKDIARYLNAREKIIGQIRGLHDVRYNKILYGFYVDGKSLKKIWIEMGQSKRTVQRWFDEALERFGELYEEKLDYLY